MPGAADGSAHLCSSCGTDWTSGRFEADCPECGGGALTRGCPLCLGVCGSIWRRATIDSNDTRLAHWLGTCDGLPHPIPAAEGSAPAPEVEWWLDHSALPRLTWACLIGRRAGVQLVLDADGREHRFDTREAAEQWLSEDEYERRLDLHDSGEIDARMRPPTRMMSRAGALVRELAETPV